MEENDFLKLKNMMHNTYLKGQIVGLRWALMEIHVHCSNINLLIKKIDGQIEKLQKEREEYV